MAIGYGSMTIYCGSIAGLLANMVMVTELLLYFQNKS